MVSGRVERICVIRYEARSAGFSANARSEMKRRGIISETLRAGRPRCWVGEKGLAEGREADGASVH
jgi:hypothetical protein